MTEPDKPQSPLIQYHLDELAIAQNPNDPRYCMPEFKEEHRVILDIGGGIGQTFIASGLNDDPERTLLALDFNPLALAYGQQHYQGMHYIRADGAELPFADNSIDLVISRVSLLHTDLPKAIREIERVLKPGGQCWITLHTFAMALNRFGEAMRRFSPKSVIFQSYVLINGACLHFFNRIYAFPFTTRYESFQSEKIVKSLFSAHTFENLNIQSGRHFLVTARKKD